jgi:TonB family protein
MRGWACALTILAATTPGARAHCADAGAAPLAATAPDWVRRPRDEDLERAYPTAALMLQIEGFAVLNCRVDSFGKLGDCGVAGEWPAGLGFGAGALSLTAQFRMQPMTVNGAPVDGGKITIPIAFKLEPQEPPTPLPRLAPAGPEASALARRLVGPGTSARELETGFDRLADRLEFADQSGAAPEVQSAAAAALRAAVRTHEREVTDAAAQVYASILSTGELEAIIKLQASNAWSVIRPGEDLDALDQLLRREVARQGRAEARAAFCRRRACGLPTAAPPALDAAIQDPQWVEAPTPEDVAAARPPFVKFSGLEGMARLRCEVDARATLQACEVLSEAPAGLGVGKAALSLTDFYRLQPRLMALGASGERVAVTVYFPPDENAGAPYSPPSPRSPRALALAKSLLTDTIAAARADAAQASPQMSAELSAGMDPSAAADARSAVAEGVARTLESYVDGLAADYAALYTEDQLAAADAFSQSAPGLAYKHKKTALKTALTAIGQHYTAVVQSDARQIFCNSHACAASRPQTAAAGSAMAPGR